MDARQFFYVYMLECRNGNYYTGYAADIKKRLETHIAGKKSAARFTRSFKPVRLLACWKVHGDKGAAMKVEYFIKRHTRAEKEVFVKTPEELEAAFIKKRGIEIKIEPYIDIKI